MLRMLRNDLDAANALQARAKETYDRKQREVFERMEAQDVQSVKAFGVQFSRSSTEYAQIQDRDAFVAWAADNEPELIQYKERAKELNATVRQRLDDGEPLPPGVGFYTRSIISQRVG